MGLQEIRLPLPGLDQIRRWHRAAAVAPTQTEQPTAQVMGLLAPAQTVLAQTVLALAVPTLTDKTALALVTPAIRAAIILAEIRMTLPLLQIAAAAIPIKMEQPTVLALALLALDNRIA
jgi:hypothetical protein